MFCPRCGTNAVDANFCPRCGGTMATNPMIQGNPMQPRIAAPPRTSYVLPIVLTGIGIGVALVLVIGTIVLMRANEQPGPAAAHTPTSPSPAAASSPASEPSQTATEKPRRKPKKTAGAISGPGDVRNLLAGLFCRDLNARGYSYVAAVDYWRIHGQPNQMDADRNGIPCETVYPSSDVVAYWGGRETPGLDLPGGLLCRDLDARGFSYPEAVAYWWTYGTPDRMDEDLNGIPCETVYPSWEVADFWYQ